jgi:hypothetical protein
VLNCVQAWQPQYEYHCCSKSRNVLKKMNSVGALVGTLWDPDTMPSAAPAYYRVDPANNVFAQYCKGKTSARDLVRILKMPDDCVVYMAGSDERGWNASVKECGKAKPFVTKAWLKKHPVLCVAVQPKIVAIAPTVADTPVDHDVQTESGSDVSSDSDCDSESSDSDVSNSSVSDSDSVSETESIQDDNEVQVAPPELELKDHEKFKNANGNPVSIYVCGERERNKCYFLARDVEQMLDIANIRSTLMHKKSSFRRGEHYVTFRTVGNSYSCKSNLFLTFIGITKLLYCSHSPHAEQYQRWADEILFVAQMGTAKARKELGDRIKTADTQTMKEVLGQSVTALAGLYVLSLGTVDELRDSMKLSPTLPDSAIIAKFGRTTNLEVRMGDHGSGRKGGYGGELQRDPGCLAWAPMCPELVVEAEADLRKFLRKHEWIIDAQTNSQKRSEIIAFPNKEAVIAVRERMQSITEKCDFKHEKSQTAALREVAESRKEMIAFLRARNRPAEDEDGV